MVVSDISDLHLTEVSPFKSIRLAQAALIKQQNLNVWEVAKNMKSPGTGLRVVAGTGYAGRRMKRCCQGELGARGTPAASGDSGCSLTSLSADKQLRLIGDVAQAAIPARRLLAFVLEKMQGY